MIYLITGVPGSGKTLYAVSTLVKDLAAQRPKRRGEEIVRRVCVDNIKDLVIPHELLCPMVLNDRDELVKEDEDGHGVWNWPDWCKPGDVIVIDEVQRHWRPRGMGAKPPREIQALETHRHLGIDFVIITQNPMLIDQNVRRLIGRHQHVRRLFGMQRAVIYDWDGCSVDPTRTKSASMSLFNYPKSAYKLYKSSELHTKQKQKIPAWLVIPAVAIIAGGVLAPTAFATLGGAMTGKGISQQQASAPKSAASSLVPVMPALAASAPQAPASVPGYLVSGGYVPAASKAVETTLGIAATPAPTEYAGCIVVRDHCGCFTPTGKKVIVDQEVCVPSAGWSQTPKALVTPDPVPTTPAAAAADGDAFAYMRRTTHAR